MKVLIYSHNPLLPTGFAKASNQLAMGLASLGHEVFYHGQYNHGMTHRHNNYWLLQNDGEPLGSAILPYHLDTIKPDVMISLLNWHQITWIKPQLKAHHDKTGNAVKWFMWLPLEAPNLPPFIEERLNECFMPVMLSEFASKLVTDGGFTCKMVPHGVNVNTFKPLINRTEIRKSAGINDKFIIGFAGANERRKMIDKLILAYQIFSKGKEDTLLSLHVTASPIDRYSFGYEMRYILKRYEMDGKVLMTKPTPFHSMPDQQLCRVFNTYDIHASATGGEGFGLCTMETMACGIPQVCSDNSTMPELVGDDCGMLVPSENFFTAGFGEDLTIINVEKMAGAFQFFYDDWKAGSTAWKDYSMNCREKALIYDEKYVGHRWNKILEEFT